MQPRKVWMRAATAGAIVLAIGGAALAASFTPIFRAEQVFVRGTVHLDAETVRRIARVHPGANVVHVDLRAAIARLERSGWIAQARASRSLPDTLVIEVRERLPVGITRSAEGSIVMGDGTIVAGARMRHLPRIWVRGSGHAALTSIRTVAATLAALSGEVRARVSVATMRPGGAVALQIRGGVGVLLGAPTELSLKAEVLEGLLTWAGEQDVEVVSLDLTVPQAPAVRTVATGSRP